MKPEGLAGKQKLLDRFLVQEARLQSHSLPVVHLGLSSPSLESNQLLQH